MSKAYTEPVKGRLLLSEPFLNDFFFKRSVILLAEHNEEGSYGLIINKPANVKIKEILPDFPEFDASVYIGGPVKTDSLFFIHTLGSQIANSELIVEGIYWGGNFDDLKKLISDNNILPTEIKFFIGYSGWTPKQLEKELKENSWVITDSDKTQIMKTDNSDLWNNVVKSMGKEYAVWVNYPVHPSLN
ncbi:MAG: YqgE/AlgH family protein [Bacteroidales bacterium]|jgi:putative transcriptional regulator